jgi:peroxiredoxin
VAVSSNPPDSSLSLSQKHHLQFDVLSDSAYVVARKFHIVYELNPDLDTLFQANGRDLRALGRTKTAELTLTPTYVVDRRGVIRYAFIDPDYTHRAEPDSILAALHKLE